MAASVVRSTNKRLETITKIDECDVNRYVVTFFRVSETFNSKRHSVQQA